MDDPQHRLELDSRLSELSRVQPWIETVADRYGFGQDARFAIHLCMEEALANVVLHGYRNEPGHPIVLRASVAGSSLFFRIDDKAPPFVPADPPSRADALPPVSLETIQPGGNGIHLLHRFAESLAYDVLPEGNRLTIGFALPSNAAPAHSQQ
jgi:anti-sigma regulatory factor (Ser/Thr protein kinase)